jgi:hypothetical protein
MQQYSEAFVGFNTAKNKHAVAIANVGREGEIRLSFMRYDDVYGLSSQFKQHRVHSTAEISPR